jgi:acyl-homoserine-lactone acylase
VAGQVQIRRTTYGVPQILAENLRAAAFALAYVQLEDYGPDIIEGLQAARGRMALVEGRDRVAADARSRLRHARAVETFPLLHEDTREIYQGFAEGVNHFIRANGADLPEWMRPDFTAYDVLARDVAWPSDGAMNSFRARIEASPDTPPLLVENGGDWLPLAAATHPADAPLDGFALLVEEPEDDQNVGSNAWALAPSRTNSGNAILLRNPHLAWTAGYYEAHVRVPGKLDFYGDYRIGGPFTVIGGFNPFLGFATTNNSTRPHEFYAFRAHPELTDYLLVDDAAIPLRREVVTVEVREGDAILTETREFLTSPFGPVVHRAGGFVYVFRPAANGEYRAGEQWLRMMQATNLEEWRAAMDIRARTTSNFTYADRDGNILYVWVSAPPALPHPAGGDSLAILATRTDQVWADLVPFDSLPQVLNPPGGYVHNENDSPHYANLNAVLDHSFSFWVQDPAFRLRSQHAAELLHNERVFSLEDVVETKHSMRMLLADRVKDDLIAAVARTSPTGEVAAALDLMSAWGNDVAPGSRGALLFETWWNRYNSLMDDEEPHAVPWSEEEPATTPRGVADPVRATEAFVWAVPETARRFGSWDVAWGEVHRVRRGEVDVPVGGCGGALGCFRVLNFSTAEDGKRVVNGGDGWILAVEFGEQPRAYSVLGYGQSPDPESPFHANQAAMFAAGEMKPVLWSEAEIEGATVYRYHPGEEW